MTKQQKNSIKSSIKAVRKELDDFIKNRDINKLQSQVRKLAQNAQKNIESRVNHDLAGLKKRFNQERKQVEKMIEAEVKKAKKFLDKQKTELSRLQKKLESYVATSKKQSKKKTTKKKATKKKATKKKTTKKKTT